MKLYEVEYRRSKLYKIRIAANDEMEAQRLAQENAHLFDESTLSEDGSYEYAFCTALADPYGKPASGEVTK